jgi:hypothetical protein
MTQKHPERATAAKDKGGRQLGQTKTSGRLAIWMKPITLKVPNPLPGEPSIR